jgi:hypothetical protein
VADLLIGHPFAEEVEQDGVIRDLLCVLGRMYGRSGRSRWKRQPRDNLAKRARAGEFVEASSALALRGEDEPAGEQGGERLACLGRLLSQHALPVRELRSECVEHVAGIESIGPFGDPLQCGQLGPKVFALPLSLLEGGQERG